MAQLKSAPKRILLKTLEVGVLIIAAFFILRYLQQSWPTINENLGHIDWSLLAVAWLFFLGYFFARTVAWRLILRGLKVDIDLPKAGEIWFLSEFSRYIPGNIWSFLGRVHLAKKKNISSTTTLVSLLIEIIFLLGGTVVFLVVFLWLWPYANSSSWRWLFVLALPVLALLLTPQFIERVVNWLLTRVKKPMMVFKLSREHLLKILLVFVSGWASYGIASLFVVRSLAVGGGFSPIWIVAGFVVAWLVGYLSFITPMGLGVREGVIVAMLAPLLTAGVASLIAIATRIWLIVSELLVLVIIGGMKLVANWKKEEKSFRQWCRAYWPETVLATSIITFTAVVGYYSLARQANFVTSLFDIGIMDQVVWNAAHGHIFQLTQIMGVDTVSRFTVHADILLVLLAPLYWIVSSPNTLLFTQVLVLALGAIPLFLLAKQVLKNRYWALLIALCYLSNPLMQRAAIFDFHSVTLATTFIIAAFYYLNNRRYGWYAVFMFLTLLTKETAALTTGAIGLYVIFAQRNWKVGGATILVSIGWFYALLWHIMPGARGGDATNASNFLYFYSQFGDTPTQIFKTILLRPRVWISYVIASDHLKYLQPILIPVAGIALLSPVILLAVPELMINMLSNYTSMTAIYFQYTSVITAIIFIAMIFGLKNILRWSELLCRGWQLKVTRGQRQALVASLIIFCLGLSTWHWSFLPGMKHPDSSVVASSTPSFAPFVNKLARTLPSSVSVSTTLSLEPHFSERPYIYTYPYGMGIADYLIIRIDDPYQVVSTSEVSHIPDQSYSGQKYQLVDQSGSVVVYQKQ